MALALEDLKQEFVGNVERKLTQIPVSPAMFSTNYQSQAENSDKIQISIPETPALTDDNVTNQLIEDATNRTLSWPTAREITARKIEFEINRQLIAARTVSKDDMRDSVFSPAETLANQVMIDMQSSMDIDFLNDWTLNVPVANIYPTDWYFENRRAQFANYGKVTSSGDNQSVVLDSLENMLSILRELHFVDTGLTDYNPFMMMHPSFLNAFNKADRQRAYLTRRESLIETGRDLQNANFEGEAFGFDIFSTDRIPVMTEGTQGHRVATDAADGKSYLPILIGTPVSAEAVFKRDTIAVFDPERNILGPNWFAGYYSRWGYAFTYPTLMFRLDIRIQS